MKIKGVYGTKEVMFVEFQRKKALRNPLKVYVYYPITNILKKIMPNKSKNFFNKSEQKLKEKFNSSTVNQSLESDIENRFSIENIIIGDNLKLSSDLISICQN